MAETAGPPVTRPVGAPGLAPGDLAYAREIEAALHEPVKGTVVALLAAVLALIVVFIAWASLAELEEVTRGEGKVIPSSKIQLVQSLEGGIIKDILIQQGDRVAKGEILLRIDDTGFSSNLGELEAKDMSLRAQIARLEFEAGGMRAGAIPFPADLAARVPEVLANERRLHEARLVGLDNQVQIHRERLQQREAELQGARETIEKLKRQISIADREYEIKAPLARRDIVPKTDLLKLEREINQLKGELEATTIALPKLEAAIREAEGEIRDRELVFRQEALGELNKAAAELAVVREGLKGARDKVERAELRSPVDGIVNTLHVNTVGGVVKPSEPLVSIVPLEDTLLVEARVKPKDIAFAHPEQEALVKITAYDFSVYGGLKGKVERISADTVYDETSKEAFYTVTVRTEQANLHKGNEVLPIIPGMVASIDILTGKKSVLEYLLKPINKAREEALRER